METRALTLTLTFAVLGVVVVGRVVKGVRRRRRRKMAEKFLRAHFLDDAL
jgi:hypothetical protein